MSKLTVNDFGRMQTLRGCGRSTLYKNIFVPVVQGKILRKKTYARQAALQNIPKIHAKEIVTRKIDGLEKSPPPPRKKWFVSYILQPEM